ncbi:MAG: hypothetical protein GY862_15685 [Gammaproteobacteria bacterium]|nr:hypothetical protein [Gammaproteobacteria bacterium]
MNSSQVYELLCHESEISIAFDTNAMFNDVQFTELCGDISRINEGRKGEKSIKIIVPAPAHTEKLHDLRQRHGNIYDHQIIVNGLKRKGVVISAFESRHAEVVAGLIGERYSTRRKWQDFKRKRCIECLGLNEKNLEAVPGTGRNCGATIDWLIAGYSEECLLVTDDTGQEFERIERKTRLVDLRTAISRLLQETCK